MKKIRVALNAITELTARYGSHVYVIDLARELSKVDTIELVLLVGRGQVSLLPKELRTNAREVTVPTSRSYWQILFHKRISNLLKNERIDVYHLPNTLPLVWKTVPTVVSIHDLADLWVRKYGLLRTGYRWLVNAWAARVADHILTVSENSKWDIVRLLGVPAEKVTVTLGGVDDRFRALDRAECKKHLKKTYGLPADFLLAPGGLSKNKNTGNLLRAYRELTWGGVQSLLVITGHASKRELRPILRQIEDLGLKDSVVLTGYVDAEEMPFFYGACSVVIYPSLYEGFGLPVVESMASGTPLVASNTSSLPEVAGNAALFVDPLDPNAIAQGVKRLLVDRDLRDTMVSRGLERVRQFSWQRTAERTLQAFRDVLSRPKGYQDPVDPMSPCRSTPKVESTEGERYGL